MTTLAFDFQATAAAPLIAWFKGQVSAVKLPLVGGKTVLIVHGSTSPEHNLQIIAERRQLFISADYIICCHGAMMPPWVQRKVPKELLTTEAVELFLYSSTSLSARAL